jgi:1-acyl-sn-glycerol-3-phosphate acyltransferase
LIYYHAAMPVDFFYVHSKCVLYRNRRMKVVADKFLWKVPGLNTLLEVFEVTPGTVEHCVSLLREGHVVAISPGGSREALFSDHTYECMWGKRVGFAKSAVDARAPIIPMFTKNCREALRTFPYFRRFFKWVYETTRLPLVPLYGMFPVKLVTYIGEPIEFDEDRTAEQLKELVKISQNQKNMSRFLQFLMFIFVRPNNE